MPDLILTIGNKNLSSWSLRPWLLMKQAGIAFTEENIALNQPGTRKILAEKSPSGLVPFLTHGDIQIWDSLAIAEYLNDAFPDQQLWPADRKARAIARAVSAEMHSGYNALRTVWPMCFTREGLAHLTTGGVQRDIDRINALWTRCRKDFGSDGPFLFGAFSIADAMFAPMVSRFSTYGPIPLSPESSAYCEMIMGLGVMAEWGQGAAQEIGQ